MYIFQYNFLVNIIHTLFDGFDNEMWQVDLSVFRSDSEMVCSRNEGKVDVFAN